jgi:hypothetical protein
MTLVRVAYRLLYQYRLKHGKQQLLATPKADQPLSVVPGSERAINALNRFFQSPEAMAGAIGAFAAVSIDATLANSIFVFWYVNQAQRGKHTLATAVMVVCVGWCR